MPKKKSRYLSFTWNGTKVGNITSLSLTIDGETIDISDFDSGDWIEKLDGRKDWNMDIEMNHNPEDDTAQGEIETDIISGDRNGTGSFGPETPVTGDVTLTGDMILNSYSVDAGGDGDDRVTSSASLEGNGPITRNVAA